jgi:hypothetical protein
MTRNEKEWVSHQPKSYLLYKVKVLTNLKRKKGSRGRRRRLLGGSAVAAAARGRRRR